MRTLTISRTQFLRTQGVFYRQVLKSPFKAEIIFTSYEKKSGINNFIGDSKRIEKSFKIPCLYQRDISNAQRTKFGISQSVTAIIWVSPLQLKKIIGTEDITLQQVKVNMASEKFLSDSVVYLEPIYDSCVGIEIRLQKITKAGQ